ncbi:MAG: molybdopterin-guanine dinucleotide biosynthesis protein B [Thermodesulfobacteriota bacterium]|nr:molybdopterin-guanine dinucleotide biosynthesis protein B [Thermodesulfobacteriota bacterium]
MIPIVSIVGRSNTGKTTLIEKVVAELKRRGYRVAVVKHNMNDFEIDSEGKDTYRHKKAGADIVIIASSKKVAMIKDVEREYAIAEIRKQFICDVDLIITEGYKHDTQPKIEVLISSRGDEPLCHVQDNLIATVSDTQFNSKVLNFNRDEIVEITDFLEKRLLRNSV